ncbi:MAG: lipase family protein [Actinomycetota bacterium]|nr:lipase family protein [Actinomycetota bacterium]
MTFVHGIGNKPERADLLEQWRVALFDDDGVDLAAMGVTSSMVYWADMLYEAPASRGGHESTVLELEQSVDAEDVDLRWLVDVPSKERAFVEGLARKVGFAAVFATAEEVPDPIMPASPLEAVPLPPWLKRRLMRVFLRDVHHYLYDAKLSPRPGESFQIRRDVRLRGLEALREGAQRPGPHVVIGHSLGSVIAYDLLTDVEAAPRVDALLTVGSPLGISEVQDGLTPPWTRDDGWPSQRLGDGPWMNVYDPLDPVCGGFDRKIAGSYRRGGTACVIDIGVSNRGSWRHAIGKYLSQERLRACLRDLLE